MININELKKKGELLNSEGPILTIYQNKKDYYLGSHVSDGTGTIYYHVGIDNLKKYLQSDITLKELYLLSENVLIVNKFRNIETIHTKEDFVDRVQCGEEYYINITDSMKTKSIEDWIIRMQ